MPPPRRAPATAPAHPHDALFRGVFGHPQRAAELLRSTLPPALTAAIDWSTLRPVDGSFVDARLRRHQADLVFLADVDGRETLLYLLLEHKSYEERLAALQLLRYLVELLCAFGARHPGRPLPPVVVYVLHHGNRAWQAPADLAHLFGAMPPTLAALQPEFRFLIEDLSSATEAELRARHTAVETLLPLLHLQQVRAARRRRGGGAAACCGCCGGGGSSTSSCSGDRTARACRPSWYSWYATSRCRRTSRVTRCDARSRRSIACWRICS